MGRKKVGQPTREHGLYWQQMQQKVSIYGAGQLAWRS